VPLVYAQTVKEATAVCDEIAGLVDWHRIERGKQPRRPRGMPKPQRMRRVAKRLRDLSHEVAYMHDSAVKIPTKVADDATRPGER